MRRHNATLYFTSIQNAMDAGYCDAVESGDDAFPYMSVVTFRCDDFLIEDDEESLDVEGG